MMMLIVMPTSIMILVMTTMMMITMATITSKVTIVTINAMVTIILLKTTMTMMLRMAMIIAPTAPPQTCHKSIPITHQSQSDLNLLAPVC